MAVGYIVYSEQTVSHHIKFRTRVRYSIPFPYLYRGIILPFPRLLLFLTERVTVNAMDESASERMGPKFRFRGPIHFDLL
jgi:hypothetical protein